MSETEQKALRSQLEELLLARGAHLDVEGVFDEVKHEHWGAKPTGAPHTLWQLLEHIRITLEDLLTFSTKSDYVALDWPREYWPAADAPSDAKVAQDSVAAVKKCRQAFIDLVRDDGTDLFAKIAWGDGQTVLREALLAADHTSYHLGQAMFLRKMLEAQGSSD